MKQNERLIFYHLTSAENARAIVNNGFRDSIGHFLTNRTWTGVWLSCRPPETADSLPGHSLLVVHLEMSEPESARWEFTGEGRPYREWLIPAKILNRRATVGLVEPLDLSTQRVMPMDACVTK